MRNPGGCLTIAGPDKTQEIDSTTCVHCNHVFFIKTGQRAEDMGGLCKICMGLICSSCVGKGCDPFEEKLKRQEQRGHALRSYGLT